MALFVFAVVVAVVGAAVYGASTTTAEARVALSARLEPEERDRARMALAELAEDWDQSATVHMPADRSYVAVRAEGAAALAAANAAAEALLGRWQETVATQAGSQADDRAVRLAAAESELDRGWLAVDAAIEQEAAATRELWSADGDERSAIERRVDDLHVVVLDQIGQQRGAAERWATARLAGIVDRESNVVEFAVLPAGTATIDRSATSLYVLFVALALLAMPFLWVPGSSRPER